MLNSFAYIVVFILAIFVLVYFFLLYYKKLFKKRPDVFDKKKNAKLVNSHQRKNQVLSIGSRQRLRTQNRMEITESDSTVKVDEKDETNLSDKKIGVKKARKLEEKKLKKEQRELEEREKAIRKKHEEEQAIQDKLIKEQERKIILEQEAKLEMDKKLQEKLELELYEQLKIDFTIEDEGSVTESDVVKEQKKLDEDMLNYLLKYKTVMIEELAGQFNLKTQVCADKIKEYLKSEKITGVIDDRGKFIHITNDEYHKVVKFILQRGRIHIKELVENSNKLIQLY